MPTTTKEDPMAPRNQRWWLTQDSEQVVINASPERLYSMVADLRRMGEWSPECQQVEWEDGATGPAVGARFVGHNRGGPRGLMRWSRRGRVLTADAGTRVTESYDVKRIPVWARILDVPTNRHRELLEGMRHTLEQLKTAAEAMSPASDQP